MKFLEIDGSYGEGGGQIVRSAVTLSCITKKPIRISSIRKNRKVPGLRPQHMVGIKLLAKICNAEVEGLEVGSNEIKFVPHNVEDRTLREDVGTAGSISLILQLLVPAVSFSQKSLKLSISGGTDVLWSPTSSYTKFVLAEAYSRMGIKFSLIIKKRGYYPKGGGLVQLEVFPSKKIIPIILSTKKSKDAKLVCSYSKLSSSIINKEIHDAVTMLERKGFTVNSQVVNENALDKGGSMLVYEKDNTSINGFDGLFDRKLNAFPRSILTNFIDNNLGCDLNLSDMLVIPASLADGLSVYRVKKITKHLETNLYVTSKIIECKYGIGKVDEGFEVRVEGKSNT